MIAQISECGRSLVPSDIDQLEHAIGMRLPDDYKAFLLRYNGGVPTPAAFPIDRFENNPYGVVQVLFRIDGKIESSNLDWNYGVMNGRIQSNLFPVGCDGSGDLICVSLFGDDAGSVVFWDYYGETPEPSYSNVYHIADSFSEFLTSLRELPDFG
jgi:cell wall assembly regulator SMI1